MTERAWRTSSRPLRSMLYGWRMSRLSFDQVNVVVPDVAGAAGFLRALGAEIEEIDGEWAEWGAHHVTRPGGR